LRTKRESRCQWKQGGILGLLLLLMGIVAMLSLGIGAGQVGIAETIRAVLGHVFGLASLKQSHMTEAIIFEVRFPRIILSLLVGSALSVSGCAMQGLFKNPMASPSICGVSSGAAFGAAMVIVAGGSVSMIPLSAFLFSTLTVFLVYYIARIKGRVPVGTLLLSGMAVSLFFSSLTSFMQYLSREEELREIVFWLMGGLWTANWEKVWQVAFLIILGNLAIFFFAGELNILSMGEDQAKDLGVNVEFSRKMVLVLTALVTGSSVAMCGIIGFVGLIIPHLSRMLVGPDHKVLIPASALAGAIFLCATDTLARTLIAPSEIPIGIITSLCGVPFFIFLLRSRKGMGDF